MPFFSQIHLYLQPTKISDLRFRLVHFLYVMEQSSRILAHNKFKLILTDK